MFILKMTMFILNHTNTQGHRWVLADTLPDVTYLTVMEKYGPRSEVTYPVVDTVSLW